MIALLTSLALAAPPLDPAALADAEVEANALIERCRYDGCPQDPRALGEAFLVRATAAAVLRGEIDTASAANARFLAPDLATSWGALLPGSDREEPEAWVRDWADPTPPGAAPPPPMLLPDRSAREPRPLPAPREKGVPAPPLELRKDAPGAARLGLTVAPQGSTIEGAVAGDLRFQVVAPLAVMLGASVGHGRSRLPEMTMEALGTDVDTLHGQFATVRAGVGPRWTNDAGSEVALFASALADTSGATYRTWEALAEDEVILDPAAFGTGVGLGGVGVHPLPREPRVAFTWDAGAEWTVRKLASSYVGGRRSGLVSLDDEERDAYARDVARLRLVADARWQPGEAGTAFYAGLGADVVWRTGPTVVPIPGSTRADLVLTPRAGASWTF